jgi:aldehyde dehydrogenase (NAD+)
MELAVKAHRNYIGGRRVDAASGRTFESVGPATGEVFGNLPASTTEDMDRAVALYVAFSGRLQRAQIDNR